MAYKVVDIDIYGSFNVLRETPAVDNACKLKTVMSVAGSDSSGGAGIEADLKTITAHGCYGLTAITCLTAQNTIGVKNAIKTTPQLIEDILDSNFTDIPINAIKTGLLTEHAIPALRKSMEKYSYKGHLVVDPVMVSTSGYDFIDNIVLKMIIDSLSPFITIITPNMIEAKCLVNTLLQEQKYDENSILDLDDVFGMCQLIHENTGISNILIKGGHQQWGDSKLTDILFISEEKTFYKFNSKMIDSRHTHGTGCTLSSAIASNLAKDLTLVNAVGNGIVYVQNGIKCAPRLGNGNGPLNHIQTINYVDYVYNQ